MAAILALAVQDCNDGRVKTRVSDSCSNVGCRAMILGVGQ